MRAVSLISPEGECKLKFGCQCAIRNSVAFGSYPVVVALLAESRSS